MLESQRIPRRKKFFSAYGLLLGLVIYGYPPGFFSSRNQERATLIRWRSASSLPTSIPTTIPSPTFRRRFLKQIEALFAQVLGMAREMGGVKLGTVALDGTKIRANASRHSALSYEHASKIETQLKAEVVDLLGEGGGGRSGRGTGRDAGPGGTGSAGEAAGRDRSRQGGDRGAGEGAPRTRAGRICGQDGGPRRQGAQTGKVPGGRVPQPPVEGPLPTDQVNLTDEESRIMPVAGGGFSSAITPRQRWQRTAC